MSTNPTSNWQDKAIAYFETVIQLISANVKPTMIGGLADETEVVKARLFIERVQLLKLALLANFPKPEIGSSGRPDAAAPRS